ncbi:hypothetical protein D3C71_699190 [compost metagenome]
MDAQVELAQAVQRDEVHALDQLAQFRAQIFAGVAFQGLLQILGQSLVGVGHAGVQLHSLGRSFEQQGAQFLPACFQGCDPNFQRLEIDQVLHEHDLGPFQLSTDLDQLLLHGRPLALDHASVFLGRLLIAGDRQGDGFGGDQVLLHSGQHAALNRGRGDDLAVGAGGGTAIIMTAADVLAALQGHGGAALVALHQA